MWVFTRVTEAFRPIARPFSVVIVCTPAVENGTPAEAMISPFIVPPPAPLMVARSPRRYGRKATEVEIQGGLAGLKAALESEAWSRLQLEIEQSTPNSHSIGRSCYLSPARTSASGG